MNLSWLDWMILGGFILFLLFIIKKIEKYMKGVADFLSANRSAGKYLVSVSSGVASMGAITIIAFFEQNYQAGFVMTWWEFFRFFFLLAAAASGWVVYRFRQTKALTMAQFFEMRYSKKFRIFTGILAYVSGVLNFGIFPSVGSKFFIYFCGLPLSFSVLGLTLDTYAVVMAFLLLVSIYFVFAGGQIAVIVTDYIQGILVCIVFVGIILYFYQIFDFDTIFQALKTAPENSSLINPYETSGAKDFNFSFFVISVVGMFYGTLSWQGTQGYNSSAVSPHEAKMGQVLSIWRLIPQNLFMLFIPICAYTVLHHVSFSQQAGEVNALLGQVDSESVKSQLTVPMAILAFLPKGFVGAMAAVMFAAFVSTHDTYLHSWGSIFVQDVLVPLRKKKFSPQRHIKALRWSILGVSIFIYLFSLLFRQNQFILMFWAVTGAIYLGGAGAVIIGGLYWKKGSVNAAWAAMISGAVISVTGIVLNQLIDDFFINGQWFWGIAMAASILIYVTVSLLENKEFDLGSLFVDKKEMIIEEKMNIKEKLFHRIFGFDEDFTFVDKTIYYLTYGWVLSWVVVFVSGTVTHFMSELNNETWFSFWKFYLKVQIGASIVIVIWFLIGGCKDIRRMLGRLRIENRDERDDGSV